MFLLFHRATRRLPEYIEHNIVSNNDLEAILKTNANGFKLTVVGNAAETIGESNIKRLNQFE